MHQIKIAPSILSADFSQLGRQIEMAAAAGADYIHVDVMDGHFVPNLTVGALIVESIQPICKAAGLLIDVHLMIEQPDRLIPAFAQSGADIITVHVETCPHLNRTLQLIRDCVVKVGVTLNPATPLSSLEEVLALVDQVLIMSVNPGFPGQTFLPASLQRIARLRKILDEQGLTHVEIEVDGGLHAGNVGEIVAAGANILISGSAIFNSKSSLLENIRVLRRAAEAGLQNP